MTTLQQKLAELTPERRAKVLKRAQELADEEKERRTTAEPGVSTADSSVAASQDNCDHTARKSA